MNDNTKLPAEVIDTDRRLQRTADELMELRWHWTMDESNPDRVSQREYARQVGVNQARISVDASAWAEWLKQNDSDIGITQPGQPQNAQDIRELKRIGAKRATAAKAIAKATGASVSNVAANKRDEVDAVLATAEERAERKGTMPEEEIEEAAKWRAASQTAARQQKDRRKAAHTTAFLSIEGKIARMIRIGGEVLADAADVQFTDDERASLAETVSRLRALLHLLDARFVGAVDVDWDAELDKITTK